MRRVRYAVAMSLDGYLAGPDGEVDWIVSDPEVDFAEIYKSFDTVLMGRRTFELALRGPGAGRLPGMKTVVFSRTLRQADYPAVTIVSDGAAESVAQLRARPGKDIWLFGGGSLFGSLAGAGVVDTVELSVMPTLLGAGTPVLPPEAKPVQLRLTNSRARRSGVVWLEYAVQT